MHAVWTRISFDDVLTLNYFWFLQWAIEQLAIENDNLKRLLLINHDFTSNIEERIKELEVQEREAEYKKWQMVKLKE